MSEKREELYKQIEQATAHMRKAHEELDDILKDLEATKFVPQQIELQKFEPQRPAWFKP